MEWSAKPDASPISYADMDRLVAWMRANGVVRLRSGALELELGPAPSPAEQAGSETIVLTEEAAEAQMLEIMRARANEMYAHVGGWRGSDDELRAMLRSGR